ncbi:class I SAM-dependent methyltransferase [Candidatus Collierbacteria bacterium]|nr:class I SAM-dependent methyltransferase [Candidatus Collierbacteria bacterium]
MKQFDRAYFLKHYQSAADKNPSQKIKLYLSLIRNNISENHKRPVLATQGRALLDIGCGYGRFLKEAEGEFETFGIDPSVFAISKARKYALNTKFEIAAISSYKPKKRFNVITAFDILEHTNDLLGSLQNIKNWLKPGGILIVVVPVYDGIFGTIGGWLDKDVTHIQKLSRWDWLKLFENKFKIVQKQGIIRYSLTDKIYLHLMLPWLFQWGQAILVKMKKI